MLEQAFSLDSLTAITRAEAQLRRALAGLTLAGAAERMLIAARAEGMLITTGRVDRLHGAIIERIARAEGTWQCLSTNDSGAVVLVHGDEDTSGALAIRLGAEGVRCSAFTAADALETLRRAESVALLPIEIADARQRRQLRAFLFPRPERPSQVVMSNALAALIEVDVALVTGITRIAARELETLEVGDALTLDTYVPEGTFLGRLPGDAQELMLHVDAQGVRFEGRALKSRMPDARLESTMQADDVPLESWTAVEIELTLDVGQVRIPLAELAALRPGTVLVPSVPSTDRVTIRANGRAIGRGTLVRVEGELAVRVDELAGAPERKPQ